MNTIIESTHAAPEVDISFELSYSTSGELFVGKESCDREFSIALVEIFTFLLLKGLN